MKQPPRMLAARRRARLSPANCGGLIEAVLDGQRADPGGRDFPPRTAGASLKQFRGGHHAVEQVATFPRELRGPH